MLGFQYFRFGLLASCVLVALCSVLPLCVLYSLACFVMFYF
jgi:hypothetical protein